MGSQQPIEAFIMQTLPYAVLLIDQDGVIRFANALAGELLDTTMDALNGHHVRDVLDHPEQFLASSTTKHWLKGRFIISRSIPLADHQASPYYGGTLLTLSDSSDEYFMLGQAAEYMSTAAAELRVPITPLHGFVTFLLQDVFGPVTPQQREVLETIQHNATRLRDLSDDLLEAGRVRSGKMRLHPTEVVLQTLLEEIRQELQGQFTARSIAWTIENNVSSPMLIADEKRLKKVLLELLDNARRYTFPGGHVVLRTSTTHDGIQFDIQDTGIGISERSKHAVFRPFFRDHGGVGRDEASGCGLSLFIIHGFVALHGGHIWFESTEGVGTTFSFVLPTNPKQEDVG